MRNQNVALTTPLTIIRSVVMITMVIEAVSISLVDMTVGGLPVTPVVVVVVVVGASSVRILLIDSRS